MPEAEYRDFYSDPETVADPRAYYASIRSHGPVMRERYQQTVMVTGYDEVMEVLTDKSGTFSSLTSVLGPKPGLPFTPEGDDISEQLEAHRAQMPWSAHLVTFDGEEHQRARLLMGSLLTFKRLKSNEDYLYGLTDRIIDGFIDKGIVDIVPDYAHATTVYAICDILGVPMADRAELLELIGPPPSQLDGEMAHKVGPDPLILLKEKFDGYIAARLEEPTGDLMSDLANSTFKDGSKPDPDLLSRLARFVYGAGQDTTSRLIAMCTMLMADNPVLQARMRGNPGNLPDLIEETLRYDPPVKVAYRVAVRSTEIGGVAIPAGTILNLSYWAANNDPARFADPDRFDIEREDKRDHLGFSKGLHACLGAPLGRMEARVALEQLILRTKDFRLSEEHHGPPGKRRFRFEPTYTFRNLADLHVEFEAD
ncbi:MAG: cytochrome P450 [Sphingomonadaceae bacterium]